MADKPRILVISSNQNLLAQIVSKLESADYLVKPICCLDVAKLELTREQADYDLVIIDFSTDFLPESLFEDAFGSSSKPEIIVLISILGERRVGDLPIGAWSQSQGAFGFIDVDLMLPAASPTLQLNVNLALVARKKRGLASLFSDGTEGGEKI